MMFYHVPKRLQLFFALRAIILMPYENVPMYRIRAGFRGAARGLVKPHQKQKEQSQYTTCPHSLSSVHPPCMHIALCPLVR